MTYNPTSKTNSMKKQLFLTTLTLMTTSTSTIASTYNFDDESSLRTIGNVADNGDEVIYNGISSQIDLSPGSGRIAPTHGGFVLNGNGVILAGNGTFQLIDASSSAQGIGFRNITLKNGNSSVSGGAYQAKYLTGGITDSHFLSNNAKLYGGAIHVENDFRGGIRNSTFENNHAVAGGAISVEGNFYDGIHDSKFISNTANTGGAIQIVGEMNGGISGSTFQNNKATNGASLFVKENMYGGITDSHFIDNVAETGGAGIYVEGTFFGDISKSYFKNNSALTAAAAHIENFTGNISNSYFENNHSTLDSGALYVANTFTGNIHNTYFTANQSGNRGGALFIRINYNGDMQSVHFKQNISKYGGGAVFVGQNMKGNLKDIHFDSNESTVDSGGGIYVEENFTGDIGENTYFYNNKAKKNGGGMAVKRIYNGTLHHTSAHGNIAEGSGGFLFVGQGMKGRIESIDIVGNQAKVNGGAIAINSGNFSGDIEGVAAKDNQAGADGGVLYLKGSLQGDLSNTSANGNTAGNSGGVLYTGAGVGGSINNGTFEENRATAGSGGAIYIGTSLQGDLASNTFIGNTATAGSGGAIQVVQDLSGIIENNQFAMNTSGIDGGALSIGGNVTGGIAQSDFIGNRAGQDGGAISIGGDLIGGITNGTISGNQADRNGGALNIGGNFFGSLDNSNFQNNQSGEKGGAIYVAGNFDATVSSGAVAQFTQNIDADGLKSIHFAGDVDATEAVMRVGNVSTAATFAVDGTLYLYDPLGADAPVDITKSGSGLMALGGINNMNGGDWNINEGTLRISYDSNGGNTQINNIDNFTLANGALMEVVPHQQPAEINVAPGGSIQLDGKVTLGSEYRYNEQMTLTDDSQFLKLSEPFSGSGKLAATSGVFSLGQYDYHYQNLGWHTNNTILGFVEEEKEDIFEEGFEVVLNPDRSGGYATNVPIHTGVNNQASNEVFGQIDSSFGRLGDDGERHRYLWVTGMGNHSRVEGDHHQADVKVKTPGFIVGYDWEVNKRSFMGVAASMTWPDFKQGSFEADGKDYRFTLYGGTRLKNNWELGYQGSFSFGDIDQSRSILGYKHSADYDVRNYNLGVSIGKNFQRNEKITLRPFASYEYLRIEADGYEENGPLETRITVAKHNEDLFRLKVGGQISYEMAPKSLLVGRLFYQGVYGDTSASATSFMSSHPGVSEVSVPTTSVEKNALGVGVSWQREFNNRSALRLDYTGLFGTRGVSNNFGATFSYKF